MQNGGTINGTLKKCSDEMKFEGAIVSNKINFTVEYAAASGLSYFQTFTGTISGDTLDGNVKITMKGIALQMENNWTAKLQKLQITSTPAFTVLAVPSLVAYCRRAFALHLTSQSATPA
jgi:hypothetical protein